MLCAGIAATLMLAGGWSAAAQNVTLSTPERPPYAGSELPKGGATTEVVRAAFAEAGHDVEVLFRPWKRAIDMAAKAADGVIANFPGYHCRHQEGFVPSQPIGSGQLGFAERAETPISWTNVDSLGEQQLKIGTVLGYANTDEFDQKVGTGWIIAVPSTGDLANLKKLSRKRIDAVVIDKFVLEHLKASEPSLRSSREDLQFNDRPREDKTLYLCFRDDAAGRAMRDTFNSGLANVDPDAVEEYFASAFPD